MTAGLRFIGASTTARDTMTRQPVGTMVLRTAAGDETLAFDRQDLDVRSPGLFHAAIRGVGAPSATGEIAVRSPAIALAFPEPDRSGKAVEPEPGLAAP